MHPAPPSLQVLIANGCSNAGTRSCRDNIHEPCLLTVCAAQPTPTPPTTTPGTATTHTTTTTKQQEQQQQQHQLPVTTGHDRTVERIWSNIVMGMWSGRSRPVPSQCISAS
eukprot:2982379-Rhodomonas_salina.1